MANKAQLAILIVEGVKGWNRWRRGHRGIKPDLRGANFTEADLTEADLSKADFAAGDLTVANLFKANLSGADLRLANLFKANLSGADLRLANLFKANLSGANLSTASLMAANFTAADLSRANLSGADLRLANLTMANLSGADLSGADLTAVNLSGASLDGANLRGSVFDRTVIGNTDLTNIKGLDSCMHMGPSIIDIQTLQRPGMLPVVFLRGCGLPDELIKFLPSILGPPKYYSCFISYSTEDQCFADRLYADLQNKGVRCWFAPHDAKGGEKLHEQIKRAIGEHDRLLLVLSTHSMNSDWVKTEIANARAREVAEGKQMLFPIRLVDFDTIKSWECFDADTGKDSAREIREYFIPDFQHWEDPAQYEPAFDGLLNGLTIPPKSTT
ncbi:MAG: toll/interleukin-1 receptor domain-containing protein [Chloroflexi bacterium]|nr:toll/interleukin-1 receptor domain-containing protein [Chloroflexota bacterium]